MRPLEELNLSDRKLPPDRKDIEKLESVLGRKLPDSFLEVMKALNGAGPELDSFVDPRGEEWGVNNFFHIQDDGSTESIKWNLDHQWEGTPKSFVPFARDGGGNMFLYDPDTDGVWIMAHDPLGLHQLAETFEEFIDGLYLNPDYT